MFELPIESFRDGYFFLSNFYLIDIRYNGIIYPSTEHFFQAMKTTDQAQRLAISRALSPGIAKRMAGPNGYTMPDGSYFKIILRPDWEQIKIEVMRAALRAKFTYTELAEKLIATYPRILIEGNNWNDKFWGICRGIGKNWLGILLMEIREELVRKRSRNP